MGQKRIIESKSDDDDNFDNKSELNYFNTKKNQKL